MITRDEIERVLRASGHTRAWQKSGFASRGFRLTRAQINYNDVIRVGYSLGRPQGADDRESKLKAYRDTLRAAGYVVTWVQETPEVAYLVAAHRVAQAAA